MKKEHRYCEVCNCRCVFHGFFKVDRVITKMEVFCSQETLRRELEFFKNENCLTPGMNAIVASDVIALVELPSGIVKKVAPEEIRFLDEKRGGHR